MMNNIGPQKQLCLNFYRHIQCYDEEKMKNFHSHDRVS